MLKFKLPYFMGVQDKPYNPKGFPNKLDFFLDFCNKSQRFYQVPNIEVQEFNNQAYNQGALLGTAMDDTELGEIYAKSFYNFMQKYLHLKNKCILEIGCGRGALLGFLKKNTPYAEGLEPGKINVNYWHKYGVKVICDSFPSKNLNKSYDIIVAFLLLEHIYDLAMFFKQLSNISTKESKFVLGIPDCEPYISRGDIGMLIHQHYHYFTANSIQRTLNIYGYKIETIEKYGGIIYAIAQKGKSESSNDNVDTYSFATFNNKYLELLHRLQFYLYEYKNFGIYCPARLINLLSQLKFNKLKFFDDDCELHLKYYPLFHFPVENFTDLCEKNKLDKLLIATRTFKETITRKVLDFAKYKKDDILYI